MFTEGSNVGLFDAQLQTKPLLRAAETPRQFESFYDLKRSVLK